MSAILDRCPSCGSELAGKIEQHCASREKPCGWVRHRCSKNERAVVDPRLGRFYVEAVRS